MNNNLTTPEVRANQQQIFTATATASAADAVAATAAVLLLLLQLGCDGIS